MSDMLGNRRFIASLDSVSSFSNFDFIYLDMRKRMSWGGRLFDNRSFYLTPNVQEQRYERRQAYRETGLMGLASYPFTRYHRLDGGLGYILRDYFYPHFFRDPESGGELVAYEHRRDNFPTVSTTFSGDSAVWKSFGPISGRRYQISAGYSPDMKAGGTLSGDVSVDWREYRQLSSRTLLATRVYGAWSDGNAPNFYYFGGLNTLRGHDFRTVIGQHAGFANVELRFPLIDVLATPIIVLQQVRGALFFDIGAAHFDGRPFRFAQNGRLQDPKASIGLVFSAAALIFILASAVTVKLGERVIHVPAVLAGALAFALTLTPATLSGAAPAIVAVMCLGAPLRALLFTVSYPLGAARGSGVGAAMGMLNGAWAITSVVGPLGGGALAEAVGARGAYGSLQALSLVAIGALWLHLRRATVSCVPGRVGA